MDAFTCNTRSQASLVVFKNSYALRSIHFSNKLGVIVFLYLSNKTLYKRIENESQLQLGEKKLDTNILDSNRHFFQKRKEL